MGAWSHEPFGNDDANDWAYDLEGKTDLSPIDQALDRVLDEEYLEAPEASEAIAAVEALATILGKATQTDAHTEKVAEWAKTISAKPSAELLKKAARALSRVLSEDSELRELWEEGEPEEWLGSIKLLQAAIRHN